MSQSLLATIRVCLACFLAIYGSNAVGSDACSNRAIVTSADVTVSNGDEFFTQSYFQHANAAAIRHLHKGDEAQTVAVEGRIGWIAKGDRTQAGEHFYKSFALGHQYHALLLDFESIADNVQPTDDIEFDDTRRDGLSGDYPYGGRVHLVDGRRSDRPLGLLFEFEDSPPMTARFERWRKHGELTLPTRVRIDDGKDTYVYNYTDIDVANRSPLWFFESVPVPNIDELKVYRLHRSLLAAHCLGDAGLMARLSVPTTVVASNGAIVELTREETRTRFESVFKRLDYTAYTDLQPPVISISDSGDLGWIAVSVLASGTARESGKRFEDRWAWIMPVRNIDSIWLNAGNAANRER